MGQLGQAFTNPNTFAAAPSGFSGSEWAARFLGAGAQGLGQGLQNQGQQRQGGAQPPIPIFNAPTPQVNPQIYVPQGSPGNNGSAWPGDTQKRANWGSNAFYG